MSQLQRVRREMSARGIDNALFSGGVTVQWLTNFTGSFGYVVISPNDAVFVTDSRYKIQAESQVSGMDVISFSTPQTLMGVLKEQCQRMGVGKLGFEPSISFSQFQDWTTAFAGIELESLGDLVPSLQKIKQPDEIARIREACKLGDACMERALSMIQVGVAEFDIGLDIEFFFRRQGAAVGFDPIVASGPNSAKPHARPSDRKIQRGDFVTLDLGCTLDGYSSDLTRTVVVGEASDRHVEIYEQVLKAEIAGCESLVAGANGKDIDGLARQILDEKGLSQYFGHSLGHGLGRQVHDPGRLSVSADEPIAVGQVWTVEPGVYIEGFGGVRIEDDVLVTESGPEILTHVPKDLLVV